MVQPNSTWIKHNNHVVFSCTVEGLAEGYGQEMVRKCVNGILQPPVGDQSPITCHKSKFIWTAIFAGLLRFGAGPTRRRINSVQELGL